MAAVDPACRRKFFRFFPKGFADPQYVAWERGYKWTAHERWEAELGKRAFAALLKAGGYADAAKRAVAIESRTNLLFSFEKMALRDAVRPPQGAKLFATGLYALLHGRGELPLRFARWLETLERLPRKQTRVLTWPLATVFGFLAQPELHFFLKPRVTRRAAEACGADFGYLSKPNWGTYSRLLAWAERLRRELGARDMIDVQSFLWVQGSDEYPDERPPRFSDSSRRLIQPYQQNA